MNENRRPLSDEISTKIKADFIESGKIKPGELLPSERLLGIHYGVSKVTIRAAIRTLLENGFVRVRNGVGTIVLPRVHEITHGLDRLASIDTFARENNHEIGTDNLRWVHEPADADASRKLRIPVGDPTLKITRRKFLDGNPAAWIVDTAPLHLVDEDQLRTRFRGSILDVMLESNRFDLEYADSEVRPCLADKELNEMLPGAKDGLFLHLDTTVILSSGAAILWGQVWMNPAYFRFSFRRRRIS